METHLALEIPTGAGAGPSIRFVRVGTLDAPQRLAPDIHIFTSTNQPWIAIPAGTPQVPGYYDLKEHWPRETLERRSALLPQIEAHRASLGL